MTPTPKDLSKYKVKLGLHMCVCVLFLLFLFVHLFVCLFRDRFLCITTLAVLEPDLQTRLASASQGIKVCTTMPSFACALIFSTAFRIGTWGLSG